jgi:nucleotide-binding universal stress UspA family protein
MSLLVSPSIAIRKILFATDFSPCSEAALPLAIDLSDRYDGLLDIVSVVPAEFCYTAQPPDPFYYRHSAEQKLARLVASGLLHGIKHREVVLDGEGDVALALTDVIRKSEIDLVVIGTHGRGGVRQVLLGSTSEEIVYSAPCPVLTVGPHVAPKPPRQLNWRRILCAADLLSGTGRALAYAIWLAKQEQARVALLHIANRPTNISPGYSEVERERVKKQVAQIVQHETGLSLAEESIVEIGEPMERILKAAEDQSVDLIVMGLQSTPHPRVSAHLPWATTHQVLCHAKCPVLTVRE